MSDESKREKFMDLYKKGEAVEDDIEIWIERWHEERWHESSAGESLSEYLGMSKEEYIYWINTGIVKCLSK